VLLTAGSRDDGVGQVDRIAVLRANALGDFVQTLPALDALAACYPDAERVLIGTPMHADLLAGRPGPVDRVVVAPVSRGVRQEPAVEEDPGLLRAFFASMRAERFDLAVQMHGGGRWSNPFVERLGARVTVGLQAPGAPPLDRVVPYVHFQHEVLRLLEVVALVGARPVTLAPVLRVTDSDRSAAARALPPSTRPLVVVHPGATDPRRRWPAASFASVADALAAGGADVVVTGTDLERAVAEEVAGRMRREARVLVGELSLPGLVGVLERAVLVVANDTGPRHLAEAVGTATVSVYWCGNLVNAGPLTRARHRPHVSWRLACPVCGATGMGDLDPSRTDSSECDHRDSYVTDVPVGAVLADALELLRVERTSDRRGDRLAGVMERA
jgi:ADP-heptose:LPS heptosyltransferase